MHSSIFKTAAYLEESSLDFAMITITKAEGSSPRHNAKMIVDENKKTYGTIGGGPLEIYAIEEALKQIEKCENKNIHYRLNKNKKENVAGEIINENGSIEKTLNMLCGGNVDIFIEVVKNSLSFVLVGSGHINFAVSRLLELLNYGYSVVDTENDFILSNNVKEKFKKSKNFITESTLTNALKKININKNSVVIIATNNSDEEALNYLIKKEVLFLGMIGSKRKSTILKDKILKETLNKENNLSQNESKNKTENIIIKNNLENINTPLGLNIGAETPEEIAVSILALVISKIKNKDALNMSLSAKNKKTVIIRGGGDIATGVIVSLKKAGFNVIAFEVEYPTVIRRTVSLANCIYEESMSIENIKSVLVHDVYEAIKISESKDTIPFLIDENMKYLKIINPHILIDATISKKNNGLNKDLADFVIALGPGFIAGTDCHIVIETMRGHNLGKIILLGEAEKNTGVPGIINGVGEKRLLKASSNGIIKLKKNIGDRVQAGDVIAFVESENNEKHKIKAEIDGIIRGLLKDRLAVTDKLKIGDIDPRGCKEHAFTISDKSRFLGYAVLSAILFYLKDN